MPSNRGNIPCEYAGISFPSQLERNVYLDIIQALSPFNLDVVECQYQVLKKPATKRFTAQYWKVDFYLPMLDIYVEAKGRRERDFMQTLKMVDYFSPNVIPKLCVVSEKSGERICKGLQTMNVHQLRTHLVQQALLKLELPPFVR